MRPVLQVTDALNPAKCCGYPASAATLATACPQPHGLELQHGLRCHKLQGPLVIASSKSHCWPAGQGVGVLCSLSLSGRGHQNPCLCFPDSCLLHEMPRCFRAPAPGTGHSWEPVFWMWQCQEQRGGWGQKAAPGRIRNRPPPLLPPDGPGLHLPWSLPLWTGTCRTLTVHVAVWGPRPSLALCNGTG